MINYTDKHIGEYINVWHVIDKDTRNYNKVYTYKTEAGAQRKFDSLDRADMFRETDCNGADVRVMSK